MKHRPAYTSRSLLRALRELGRVEVPAASEDRVWQRIAEEMEIEEGAEPGSPTPPESPSKGIERE